MSRARKLLEQMQREDERYSFAGGRGTAPELAPSRAPRPHFNLDAQERTTMSPFSGVRRPDNEAPATVKHPPNPPTGPLERRPSMSDAAAHDDSIDDPRKAGRHFLSGKRPFPGVPRASRLRGEWSGR